jgi:hypothetical protein
MDVRGVHGSLPAWQVEGQAFERLVEINFTGKASVPLFQLRGRIS